MIFRAWKFDFCKAGLVWVSWEQCGKTIFGEVAKDSLAFRQCVELRRRGRGLDSRCGAFSPRYWVNNVPGPIVSSPSLRKKKLFRSLKNWFSARPQFSSSYLRKTRFQVPRPIHIWILGGMAAVQACAKKKSEPEKLFFCKAQFHPVGQYKGSRQKKGNAKGELQTSRISSNLRIWQSYSRVPQILKVLCVWYSWKYVARLGFEPLKFLYSEFLYNTQAVYILLYTNLLRWGQRGETERRARQPDGAQPKNWATEGERSPMCHKGKGMKRWAVGISWGWIWFDCNVNPGFC